MELDYKSINLNRHKGRAVSQITLEEDLNVPDQKPDIFRIVHKQGEFHPDEIKGEPGKVKVRGVFRYRILYIAEGEERGPEVLEGSIPVDEIIFLNGLEEGDLLDFRWDMEDLHASAIHSRKANVKSILSLCAEAICEQPVLLLKKPEEEDPETYLKTCLIRLQQEVIHKRDTLRVKEELTLPPGRPNIRRIIWKELRLQGTEVRPEEGKLLIKGELVVFFLYESEEEPARIQWLEQSVPFGSEIECAACHSDLSGMTEVTLLRGELELQADYDGEPRRIRLDAVLTLHLRYFEEQSEETVCDAYRLDCELTPGRKRRQWNYVQNVSDSRARVSGRMKLQEGEPKVLQILNSGAFLHLDHTERGERGLELQGTVELWVLYMAADDAQPIACAVHAFPFEHTVELQNPEAEGAVQAFLCLDQLQVGMLDVRELEMKAILQAQILCSCPRELELVEEIQEEPMDAGRLKQMPGLVIHVVQPGETLWDIAKNHVTTCRAVLELNGLKEEKLKEGQKMLLVKGVR